MLRSLLPPLPVFGESCNTGIQLFGGSWSWLIVGPSLSAPLSAPYPVIGPTGGRDDLRRVGDAVGRKLFHFRMAPPQGLECQFDKVGFLCDGKKQSLKGVCFSTPGGQTGPLVPAYSPRSSSQLASLRRLRVPSGQAEAAAPYAEIFRESLTNDLIDVLK